MQINDVLNNRWKVVDTIGRGGQGEVFKVIDTKIPDLDHFIKNIRARLSYITAAGDEATAISELKVGFEKLNQYFVEHRSTGDSFFALKKLRQPSDAKNSATAADRMRSEIAAFNGVNHSNIVKLTDHSEVDLWYVMPFYSQGSLKEKIIEFKGNIEKTLRSFIPLAEGVHALHQSGRFHRDIKPENIFLTEDNNFILGDLGLAISAEPEDRLTDTEENVGSRDWMPLWAQGQREETPSFHFDIYALAKVLWATIGGKRKVDISYGFRGENTLEELFPTNLHAKKLGKLLKQCVVQKKEECTITLEGFISELKNLVKLSEPLIDSEILGHCQMCYAGRYEKLGSFKESGSIYHQLYGVPGPGNSSFLFVKCNNCGHLVPFHKAHNSEDPLFWRSK